jgi:SnoaL-like domain
MALSAADRAALSDLVHRYAATVDDRQFRSLAGLFTVTAELVVPEPPTLLQPIHAHRGQQAIAAAVGAVAQSVRTEHAIVGEVYEVYSEGPHPATARGRVACVAHHWNERNGELVDVVWHLRYDDAYEATDTGWRISRRALTINAIETRQARRVLPHDPG